MDVIPTMEVKYYSLYDYICYIPLLFIISKSTKYRNYKKLSFHIKQGELLTIIYAIITLLAIIFSKIFVAKYTVAGSTAIHVRTSILGIILIFMLYIIPIIYSFLGMKYVKENIIKDLPFFDRIIK